MLSLITKITISSLIQINKRHLILGIFEVKYEEVLNNPY